MKNIFIASILLFTIFACGGGSSKQEKPPMDGPHYVGDSINFTKYLYKEGIVVSETPFVNNKAHGTAIDYFMNGNKRLTVEYKDAKRDGMSVSYYESGEKHGETPYVNGKIEGIKYIYKKDGSVTVKAPFEDGKPTPGLEEYDAEGKLIPQPTIKFKMNGGTLRMELSDKSFTKVKFYHITPKVMIEVPMSGNVGNLTQATKGTKIRAYYSTPRGAEGAVDATY